MEYSEPYKLIINRANELPVLVCKKQNGVEVNFKDPLTRDKRPKIYILKHNSVVVYIGYTSQSLSKRLSSGFRANGANGYHGYKWAKTYNEVDLLVFDFDEKLPAYKEELRKRTEFYEAIESELVFRIKTETDHWPKYQNEIHFNNHDSDEVKVIAEEIYKKIK